MAGSVNKVILLGNLGGDPDIRTMQNGKKVCSFSMATSDSWKDKETGEKIKLDDIISLRPGGGIDPKNYKKIILFCYLNTK